MDSQEIVVTAAGECKLSAEWLESLAWNGALDSTASDRALARLDKARVAIAHEIEKARDGG